MTKNFKGAIKNGLQLVLIGIIYLIGFGFSIYISIILDSEPLGIVMAILIGLFISDFLVEYNWHDRT